MERILEMLKKLVSEGFFGTNELLGIEDNSRAVVGTQFAAKIWFLKLVFQNEDGNTTKLPIVAKSLEEDAERARMASGTQFKNEAAMYNVIVPFLGAIELRLSPKSYYSHSSDNEDISQSFIVLEDLAHRNFKAVNPVFFDKDHVLMTMKTLGRFHGLSYKANKSDPGKLVSLGKMLQIVRRCESPLKMAVRRAQLRGFQPVIDENQDNPIVKEALDRIIDVSLDDQRTMFAKPEEPFAVILHGDVMRDNVLFQYDEDGRITAANMFDFGYSSFGDCTTDVSFFLYLHTTQKTREKYWDDFLSAYWDGVISVEEHPGFTYEEFLRNFSKRALYGFVNASFFLPLLLEKNRQTSATDFLKMKDETDWINWGATMGGEEGTLATSNIIRHMLAKGYLEDFVRRFV